MKALVLAALLCASPALADTTLTDEQAIELARSIRACQLELAATQAQPTPSPVLPAVISGVVGLGLGVAIGFLVAGATAKK